MRGSALIQRDLGYDCAITKGVLILFYGHTRLRCGSVLRKRIG